MKSDLIPVLNMAILWGVEDEAGGDHAGLLLRNLKMGT